MNLDFILLIFLVFSSFLDSSNFRPAKVLYLDNTIFVGLCYLSISLHNLMVYNLQEKDAGRAKLTHDYCKVN